GVAAWVWARPRFPAAGRPPRGRARAGRAAPPPMAETHSRELLVLASSVVAATSKNLPPPLKKPIWPVAPLAGPFAVKVTVRPVTSATPSLGLRLVMLLVAVLALLTVRLTSLVVPALIEST